MVLYEGWMLVLLPKQSVKATPPVLAHARGVTETIDYWLPKQTCGETTQGNNPTKQLSFKAGSNFMWKLMEINDGGEIWDLPQSLWHSV